MSESCDLQSPPNNVTLPPDPRKLPADSITEISSADLEQRAAVMARLQCKYINMTTGEESRATWSTYEAAGHTMHYDFTGRNNIRATLPDGALVMFGADAMWSADPWLERWFKINHNSTRKAHFIMSGTAGLLNFWHA